MAALFEDFDPEDEGSNEDLGSAATKELPDHSELVAAPWKQEDHPNKSYRPYAGVGSRSTPRGIQRKMVEIARTLGNRGWTLRSGGAEGADAAFDWGAGLSSGHREIYLPTTGWRSKTGPHYHVFPEVAYESARRAWMPYVERADVSPWGELESRTKKFMARNVCQVCGPDLNRPAEFLVCWTPDGVKKGSDTTSETGGTGQAIRVASRMDVPVFNLKRDEDQSRIASSLMAEES